ncbi:MAG: cytochrome c biogenesis protein CcsA [Myxococcales bacterium]|nr:cytochrome c biogenesis protein CcsA [Myxococcales bacterium]MCB9534517.1 cytochrome c biogenesis protein CcsA [Myxococcales bacterium]
MTLIGILALLLAFGAGAFTTVVGAFAGARRSARFAEMSRLGLFVTVGAILIASASLLYGFVSHDFSLRYVHGRSDLRMPIAYVMAAFWGGQEGSLLLWTSVAATCGGVAAFANRDRLPTVMPYFHAVLAGVLTALVFVLVFVANPFERFFVLDTPIDGEGLNPLLQNPLMVIHPPCLLSGFASFVVPYAFGMAALLARETGTDWLRASRRWTLLSWLLLSVGNILGGMWAYQELGWGGYWAWDAVENAALIPWFMASAYLHSVIIQEQRGMFRKWNAVLVTLTFCLTLLGTWMTRSGLIQSVHTFAESEVGPYFLGILIAAVAFSVVVVAARWRGLTSDHYIDSPVSREGAFLLNNWMLVGLGFVVLWGTLFPKMKELATGSAVAIGPVWFNRFTTPLGLILMALMVAGTLLPWRRVTARALRRNFTAPTLATLAIVVPSFAAYYTLRMGPLGVDPMRTSVALAMIGVTLVVYNVVTIAIEIARGARARARVSQDGVVGGLLDLFARHRRRYGGYIVHLGVVFIFLAFAGNASKVDVDATLRVGDTVTLGDYVVTFDALRTVDDSDKRQMIADMTLTRAGRSVDTLHPARFDFNDYSMLATGRPDPMKITSEIYIRSTPLEDVYVALLQTDDAQQAAAFKLVVLPFTWWFWFGGVVLVAGTLICLWPERDPLLQTYWRYRAARALELVAIGALTLVPLGVFAAPMRAWAEEPVAAAPAAPTEHVPGSEHDHEHDRAPVVLDDAQTALVSEAFARVMTTCTGCAGKSLATASPSCYPSNQDKQRIREMAASGMSLDQILGVFVDERGEAALAVPPDSGVNRLSWVIPGLAFIAGAGVIATFARRWSRPRAVTESASSTTGDADVALLGELERELAARS